MPDVEMGDTMPRLRIVGSGSRGMLWLPGVYVPRNIL